MAVVNNMTTEVWAAISSAVPSLIQSRIWIDLRKAGRNIKDEFGPQDPLYNAINALGRTNVLSARAFRSATFRESNALSFMQVVETYALQGFRVKKQVI